MTKKLHIIAFDVPFPANYGGVIDVFYRIKSLYELDVEIYLHCFEYGRGEAEELTKYCKEIYYYKRAKKMVDFISPVPFIVQSRVNKELLSRLLKDDFPILFEGIHSTWYLTKQEIINRITLVRTHNVEHEYYNSLALKSKGIKKFYFQMEALKLKKYEQVLSKAKFLLCISQKDLTHFKSINNNSILLHPSFETLIKNDNKPHEKYILFHGNLSVLENIEAVFWIIENIYDDSIQLPLIIAGKDPSQKIKKLTSLYNITLIENPSAYEMNELISNATVHLLYSTQSTGIKLKLLSALQTNGIVIANSILIEGSDLENYCIIEDNEIKVQHILRNYSEYLLSKEEIIKRKELFELKLNVNLNNQKIIDLI